MGRHSISGQKAKEQLEEMSYRTMTSKNDPRKGGGFFITLTVTQPKYKVLAFFIWAASRSHALAKVKHYPEFWEFLETAIEPAISVNGAGLQPTYRAEGPFHIVDETKEKARQKNGIL